MALLNRRERRKIGRAAREGRPIALADMQQAAVVRGSLEAVVGVRNELAQFTEPAHVLAALETVDPSVLRYLIFEQLYSAHPEWQVNGWPEWPAQSKGTA